MSADKVLVPARPHEIPVGVPLPFALYGRGGALIAPTGYAVPDEQARQRLLQARPYREASGVERDDSAEATTAGSAASDTAGGAEHADPLRALRHNVEAVQLVFQLPGDPDRRTTSAQFFGKLDRQALVVSAPHLGGQRSWHQHEALALTVRMTSGRTVYAFESAVLRASTLPVPHLYLRYPSAARQGAFRGAVRLETSLPAVARMSDARQFGVTIVDISGAGCAVDSDHLLGEVGSGFELVFRTRLSEQSYTITVPVVIRNLPRAGGRGRTRHGLQFGGDAGQLDWHLRLAIKAFIYENLLEG